MKKCSYEDFKEEFDKFYGEFDDNRAVEMVIKLGEILRPLYSIMDDEHDYDFKDDDIEDNLLGVISDIEKRFVGSIALEIIEKWEDWKGDK